MGELADSELKITDKKNAEQIIEQADDKEKAEIIQNKNQALQKKICAITVSNNGFIVGANPN